MGIGERFAHFKNTLNALRAEDEGARRSLAGAVAGALRESLATAASAAAPAAAQRAQLCCRRARRVLRVPCSRDGRCCERGGGGGGGGGAVEQEDLYDEEDGARAAEARAHRRASKARVHVPAGLPRGWAVCAACADPAGFAVPRRGRELLFDRYGGVCIGACGRMHMSTG